MKPQDEFWWAYTDGEMTPAEAAQYDRTLDAEDRSRMETEMEMERCLGEYLAVPVPDSDEAWKASLALIAEAKRVRRPRAKWLYRTAGLAIPIAAMVLVAVYAGYEKPEPAPWFLSMNENDASAAGTPARLPEVLVAVRNLLRDRAVDVAFDPLNSLEAEDAPYRLLAAREGEYSGESVVELLFECNGHPAKVVIANGKGNAAREIDKAVASGHVAASRVVGEWRIAAIGAYASDGLLCLIDVPDPVPAPPETPEPEDTSKSDVPPDAQPDTVEPPATPAPGPALPQPAPYPSEIRTYS